MIKAIIIDDEQHSIDRLNVLLQQINDPDLKITGAFGSVADGAAAIKHLKPDLVFLDVQLHDKTGFDLLQQLPEINFQLIFTTAYDKYAVKAFKFSAVDYLLKPVDADDLAKALKRGKERIASNDLNKKLDALFHNLSNVPGVPKKIHVPTIHGLVFLDTQEIVRCEAEINYTNIFLKDGHKLTVAKPLKEFEEMLTDHNFFRVHHSHLVNLSFVKTYHKGKGGWLGLADGTQIDVSFRRKDQFLKKLAEM